MELNAEDRREVISALRANRDPAVRQLAEKVASAAMLDEIRDLIGEITGMNAQGRTEIAERVLETLETLQGSARGLADALGAMTAFVEGAIHEEITEGVTESARSSLLAWRAMDTAVTGFVRSVRAAS